MKTPNYVFDDELYHHGIIGQMWGRRRFQNEDGSWTPEGRERYSEGDGNERKKVRVSYSNQKYKADYRSKARQDKDRRAAQEERNRIREKSKTDLLSRKKQGKLERLDKKEKAKLDNQGRPKFGKSTKNMSDEDLQKAVERLKLQAEYNKQYILASNPNPALVKADRFFEGPTGKMVSQIAINTIPNLITQSASKILENQLKYNNPLDREKAKLDNEKARLDNEKTRVEIESKKNPSGPSEMDKENARLDLAKKRADIESTRANARKANAEAAEREAKATVSAQERHREEAKARAEKMFGSKGGNSSKGSSSSNTTKVRSSDEANEAFYNRIKQKTESVANKAANSLSNAASEEIKNRSQTIANEAKSGVKAGVNAALDDLLGRPSNGTSSKALPAGNNKPIKSLPASSLQTYTQEEMFKILKGLGRI